MRSLLLFAALLAAAAGTETFHVRLTPSPAEPGRQGSVAGTGSATARLDGRKLIVEGSFQGLPSAATAAHVLQGSMPGVRGKAILDLKPDASTAGKFTGQFDLTEPQTEALHGGRLYIQIDTAKASEGNIWGWLLPAKGASK